METIVVSIRYLILTHLAVLLSGNVLSPNSHLYLNFHVVPYIYRDDKGTFLLAV